MSKKKEGERDKEKNDNHEIHTLTLFKVQLTLVLFEMCVYEYIVVLLRSGNALG